MITYTCRTLYSLSVLYLLYHLIIQRIVECLQLPSTVLQVFAALNVVLGQVAATASPGSLLEKQNLGPCYKPESESAFKWDSQVVHMHVKVWEALLSNISIKTPWNRYLTWYMSRFQDIVTCLSTANEAIYINRLEQCLAHSMGSKTTAITINKLSHESFGFSTLMHFGLSLCCTRHSF